MPSNLHEDPWVKATDAVFVWCGAHPRATLRMLAVVALAASGWWLVVFPGSGGYLAVAVAAAATWAAFTVARRPAPVSAGGDPHRVVRPARLVVAPEPVECLAAVTVGETLEGKPRPWTMPIWTPGVGGMHWLIVGITRSGKSALVWAMVHAIAPWIRAGHVELWGVDPKRGAELGRAPGLFSVLVRCKERKMDEKGETAAQLLESAVERMDRRYDVMETEGVSVWTPTVEEPLIVVWLDEVAQLVTVPNTNIQKRIKLCYEWLLRQGAAAGIVVWSCTQDPRKEIINMRPLIPGRVLFHVYDAEAPDMVLGKGAYKLGAEADLIQDSEKGVAFVWIDGDAKPTRVKAALVKDVPAMGVEFTAPTREAA